MFSFGKVGYSKPSIVKKRPLKFRNKSLDFLEALNEGNIPLVIMSAAPGDMIREYLDFEKRLYPNIHIIANFFIFKGRKAVGVRETIIHSHNKHETEIKTLPIYKQLLKRRNVLLLGDNYEDTGMIQGFPYNNLIKIGFLNENIEQNLEQYKEAYDVVITNDGDFTYINQLLKRLTPSPPPH